MTSNFDPAQNDRGVPLEGRCAQPPSANYPHWDKAAIPHGGLFVASHRRDKELYFLRFGSAAS